jgi:CubicO group peptidase (beta-lactamase class C family)
MHGNLSKEMFLVWKLTRRSLAGVTIGALMTDRVVAAIDDGSWAKASTILEQASASGQVRGSVLHVKMGSEIRTLAFGDAKTVDRAFLLGSISKPIAITGLMTLYDRGRFDLQDPVTKFIPEFKGDGREKVLVRHLLTHVSGLPDQLPENAALRSSHASLAAFAKAAARTPLHFPPGTRYEYSSMAIMLAAEIAQRLSGIEFKELIDKFVLQPLGMHHSAMGMGRLKADDIMPCQVEFGAVESGGGSTDSKSWDWNSSYWRELGAPWGGAQASAGDVGLFLQEFMTPAGKLFKTEVAQLMIRNHNPKELPPRGLGFDVGLRSSCKGCSETTFGHTGSTGTIAWADPTRDRLCVILTTLPANAVEKHPRQLASDLISN